MFIIDAAGRGWRLTLRPLRKESDDLHEPKNVLTGGQQKKANASSPIKAWVPQAKKLRSAVIT